MKLHLNKADGYVINACATGAVVINGESYTRSLIVSPDSLIENWTATETALTAEHLEEAAALAEAGTVVLLGVGEKQPPILPAWHAPFIRRQAVLEAMSLRAACRTYNILHGDGRTVVAALVFGGAHVASLAPAPPPPPLA